MSNYTISYQQTIDVEEFGFWCGAASRMEDATEEQREQVFERVAELCEMGDAVTETDINDLVWFECDDIFFPEEEGA